MKDSYFVDHPYLRDCLYSYSLRDGLLISKFRNRKANTMESISVKIKDIKAMNFKFEVGRRNLKYMKIVIFGQIVSIVLAVILETIDSRGAYYSAIGPLILWALVTPGFLFEMKRTMISEIELSDSTNKTIRVYNVNMEEEFNLFHLSLVQALAQVDIEYCGQRLRE